MNKSIFERGAAATTILVVIIVLVVAGAGLAYFVTQNNKTASLQTNNIPTPGTLNNSGTSPIPNNSTPPSVVTNENSRTVVKQPPTGKLLAGTTSPLLEFNQVDYNTALASNKLIVLYYYANWCPICKAEFPKAEAAFNQLQNPNVIGFRVNFNDNETEPAETALASEHGVAYQHTKVFVKNGQRILKSPETWETDRYLTEINKAQAQ